jgi:regulator of protease activity HflC (stomatin/prohibitin superfamily)
MVAPAKQLQQPAKVETSVDILDGHELVTNSPDGLPEGTVRLGWVSAQPSEFLVVYRDGKLRERASGQGARCFKLPGDSVAVIPTTLKEVVFKANQITADNVDVRLRGIVVYRIADPLRIYKLINFTHRAHAEAKLARMIADMCRSTAKWLVANMAVQECVRRRKEEIAAALKRELAQVVSTSGDEGWGVEIVTIDIQDIYIQDEQLFASMQAAFKSERERDARLAALETKREVEKRELLMQGELARERHAQAMAQAEMAAAQAMAQAEMAAAQKLAQIEQQRRQDETGFTLEQVRAEQVERIARLKVEEAVARERLTAEAALEREKLAAEGVRLRFDEQIRELRARIEAENAASPASLQRTFVVNALPAVAETVAKSMGNMRLNVVQGAGNGSMVSPLQMVLQSVMEVFELYAGRPRAEG